MVSRGQCRVTEFRFRIPNVPKPNLVDPRKRFGLNVKNEKSLLEDEKRHLNPILRIYGFAGCRITAIRQPARTIDDARRNVPKRPLFCRGPKTPLAADDNPFGRLIFYYNAAANDRHYFYSRAHEIIDN